MKKNPRRVRQGGFALVVTLSLMILLTVIAVGLLSISTISIRASSQSSALNIARSNARLGMMMALGELQKNLGTDTSVSAPASSVINGAARPHLVGMWQRPSDTSAWPSWHWVPKNASSPDYSAKKSLFKGWLVSTASAGRAQSFNLPQTSIIPGTNVVTLVGNSQKPLANNGKSNVVNADKIRVGAANRLGKFAWSVSDESTKAPIHLESPAAQTLAQEIGGRSAPRRVRADVVSSTLEKALREPKNLISMETAIIPGGEATKDDVRMRYHDFTTSSLGLLTDTALGGLKVDLTPIFEDEALPGALVGAFRSPNIDSPYDDSFAAVSGKPKWNYLRDVYRKYRSVSPTDRGITYSPDAPDAPDLKVDKLQFKRDPDTQRLLPVIAKFQLVFSIVTHIEHLDDRKRFYDTNGVPLGNNNYGVPHLVYDPIVTLYNPYDVAIDMTRMRIRVWDPPVGFRFTKLDRVTKSEALFRPSGEFFGLANFQNDYENDNKARKTFTLALTDGTANAAGGALQLLPGEVKVFSPRVDSNWNWAMETRGGDRPYAFFDHKANSNFGNIDYRTYDNGNGNGAYGMESVPGWRGQAGLSVDHLSYGARPDSTKYTFEKTPGAPLGAYVPIRLSDSVRVEAKAMIANGSNSSGKSFQVDILAGKEKTALTSEDLKQDSVSNSSKVVNDRIRSYTFQFADVVNEMLEPDAPSVITREYQAGSLLQRPNEPKIPGTNIDGPGGKKMFAVLEMSARATGDPITDSKAWLYNNPIVEGAEQNTTSVGLANQSYDLRLRELFGGFKAFPDGVDIDLPTGRGYFGASSSSGEGSSFVQMMHVPALPMASLGDLVNANLVSSSALPRVVHPFGNSYSHPLVTTSAVSRTLGTVMLDHTYLLNDGLWDKYYFSSIADYSNAKLSPDTRSRADVMEGVLAKTRPALNERLVPISSSGSPKDLAARLDKLDTVALSRQMGAHLSVAGPFNLSSTSVDAWRAVLSSLRDRTINGERVSGSTVGNTTFENDKETPFVRMSKPLAGADAVNNIRWAGYRSLSDSEIQELATEIVAEITKRGVEDQAPAFSVAEFVNRRIGSANGTHVLKGILQTAIDETDINKDYLSKDGNEIAASSITGVRKKGATNVDAMTGNTGEGTPSVLTQGDLMSALAPIVTVRGDTFKIRSYGEATDQSGNNVLARAWCEVVVQRIPEFVDPTDLPETAIVDLKSSQNKSFGRRFNVVSFRWLNEKEI